VEWGKEKRETERKGEGGDAKIGTSRGEVDGLLCSHSRPIICGITMPKDFKNRNKGY
jgi:hypothetical protein